jgi:hypothetical protein
MTASGSMSGHFSEKTIADQHTDVPRSERQRMLVAVMNEIERQKDSPAGQGVYSQGKLGLACFLVESERLKNDYTQMYMVWLLSTTEKRENLVHMAVFKRKTNLRKESHK